MNHNKVPRTEGAYSPQAAVELLRNSPGVLAEEVADSQPFVVDLGAFDTYKLAPTVGNPARGVTQTLRYFVTAPNDASYALVEGNMYSDDGQPTTTRFFLTELASKVGGRARVASVLTPGMTDELDGKDGRWKSGVSVMPDNTHLAFMHSGDGSTEVVGAYTETPGNEAVLPFQVWAAPSADVYEEILSTL
ncbi:MAG TPA: hypothetical protein VF809_00785 [Candidatus Saccharimonadales bacterium]